MTFYAVIDTNVLVSALLSIYSDTATVQVVNKMFDGTVIPVFSELIIAEYKAVLSRKKFDFSKDVIEMLLSVIQKYGKCIEPTPTGEILTDMKDLPFYEVVMDAQTDEAYLVTGNIKHFPQRPFIVTARELIEIINLTGQKTEDMISTPSETEVE